ncbi:MAG: endonuclease/exonuclease/phosphatase family protein, partial [Muribaculaceae bacterium]|nr:endonuclease/exonuclease/phosphatase family protein [Muribaculaceae bacterium]
MKRIFLLPLLALAIALGASAQENRSDNGGRRQYQVFGVAFYNLENLFDTINNNGSYDLEYSPEGAKKWNGRKYRSKIANLARAITSFTTPTTPNGPAFIGVSEIENRSVLEDLVKAIDERLKSEGKQPWHLRIVHHDSPDRRGVDVGALYNERYFKFMNVTNTPLIIADKPNFRTRDQMCVTGRMGADTVSIIVNHWPSRLGGQEQSSPLREAAAATSKHIADSIWALRPNEGVIVMGDLNDDPQNKSCAQVIGASKKAKGVA